MNPPENTTPDDGGRAASLRPGRGMAIARVLGGQAASLRARPRKWRHPWEVTPQWCAAANAWKAQIHPGFVNARSPVVRTTAAEQTALENGAAVAPVQGRQPDPEQPLEIPLYLGPALPLTWRPLGFDGPSDAAVPQYFVDRGAVPSPPMAGGDDAVFAAAPPPAGLRLLRACDVILHAPRQALTSQVTLAPGLATGSSAVTQTLSLRDAAPGDALRVRAGAYAAGAVAQIDPLAGYYEEQTWDELLLATVYLLSPVGAPLGSPPDGTWQAFVRHDQFWNLCHGTPGLRAVAGDPGTPYIPPLAGGAAQLVINFLTASANDATSQAINILSAHSQAGLWWTPTGGGHDAEFPPAPVPEPKGETGLDKAGRLQAQRMAAAAAVRTAQLDPDFPFRALPFPLDLLQ